MKRDKSFLLLVTVLIALGILNLSWFIFHMVHIASLTGSGASYFPRAGAGAFNVVVIVFNVVALVAIGVWFVFKKRRMKGVKGNKKPKGRK